MDPTEFLEVLNRLETEDPVEVLSKYSDLSMLTSNRKKILVNHPLLIDQRDLLKSLNIVKYDSFTDLLDRSKWVYEDLYERDILFDMLLKHRDDEFIVMYFSLGQRRKIDVIKIAEMLINDKLTVRNDIMAVFIISNISVLNAQADFDLFIQMDNKLDIFSKSIEDMALYSTINTIEDNILDMVIDTILSFGSSNKEFIDLFEYILVKYNMHLDHNKVMCQSISSNNLTIVQLSAKLLQFTLDEYSENSRSSVVNDEKIIAFLFDNYGGIDLCKFLLNILRKKTLCSAMSILKLSIYCKKFMPLDEMYEYVENG